MLPANRNKRPWRALPKHLAVLLGKAWLRLNEGTILPWLFGRLRAAREWREIIRQRRLLTGGANLTEWGMDQIRSQLEA